MESHLGFQACTVSPWGAGVRTQLCLVLKSDSSSYAIGRECKLVQPLQRTAWRFLKKIQTELPYNPAILLLGIYPEKIIIWKDICIPMFFVALFTISKTWRQKVCPLIDKRIKSSMFMQWNITKPWKRNEMRSCVETQIDSAKEDHKFWRQKQFLRLH